MNAVLQWFPLLPVWLVLVIGAALFVALACGNWLLVRKSVPKRWRFALGALRVGMIIVFTMGLLRPVLTMPRNVVRTPDVLVLVDTSRSMGQTSTGSSGSRLDEIRQALQSSPAVKSAARTKSLHWFTFDKAAHPIAADALDRAEPQGDSTDLGGSLKSAVQALKLQSAAGRSQSAATRVLVASDGQDQGADDAVAVARDLGIVVDVLAPASAGAKTRAAATIADVQGARRVLLGSDTTLLATIRVDGAAAGLALVLEDEGREIHRYEVGDLTAGREARIELTDHPAEPGLKRYTLQLVQGDAEVGAKRAVNVQVTDNRHEVLMLEDTWRWDFKYLRRLLEDDPSFNFTAFLSRGGSAFVQFGEPERRVQLGGFPHSRRELDGFDTLILGNLDPRAWPRGLARHIYDAVAEGGKSLVVIAGPHLGDWTSVVDLTRLLPVELTRDSGTPVAGPVALHLTPEGTASGWFAIQSVSGEGVERLNGSASAAPVRLSPVDQVYPVLRKRPAATVLLEAAEPTNAYGPLIVMAEHTVGRGRVLFIGTDTLWRWQTMGPRTEGGATLYSAFWQHALRALAPPEPTSKANQLSLRPERTLYRTGERVRLTAEWRSETADAAASSGGTNAVTASVVLPDGQRLPLDLVADERNPSRLAAQFEVKQPGPYRIEAAVQTHAQVVAQVTALVETVPRPGEMDDAPVDLGLLGRLAFATGGRVIDPTAVDGWLPATHETPATVVERQSFDLWHNFALMLLLCVLMAADWSLRLFRGYV